MHKRDLATQISLTEKRKKKKMLYSPPDLPELVKYPSWSMCIEVFKLCVVAQRRDDVAGPPGSAARQGGREKAAFRTSAVAAVRARRANGNAAIDRRSGRAVQARVRARATGSQRFMCSPFITSVETAHRSRCGRTRIGYSVGL